MHAAATEADVRIGIAAEVELVGIGENLGVPVPRR